MAQVTVSEEALRELVREALDGGHLGDLTMPEEEEPVNVNDCVDPSAAVTDPINPNFVPQTKPELDVALKQLTKGVPVERVPRIYKAIDAVVKDDAVKEKEDDDMKKAAQGGTTQVEEAVRLAIRKMLQEAELPPVKKIPFGVHGAEYMRRMEKTRGDLAKSLKSKETEEELEPADPSVGDLPDQGGKRKAYKSTAVGGTADVGGASFQDIAKELGLSVAGAKRAVDMALSKAQWMAQDIDPDDLEILVLQSMNKYIDTLQKTGELSPADVQLMKDHPEIVRDLEGFREFLDGELKARRKEGQKLYDPIGESHLHKVAEAMNSVGIKAKVVRTRPKGGKALNEALSAKAYARQASAKALQTGAREDHMSAFRAHDDVADMATSDVVKKKHRGIMRAHALLAKHPMIGNPYAGPDMAAAEGDDELLGAQEFLKSYVKGSWK